MALAAFFSALICVIHRDYDKRESANDNNRNN